MNLTKISSNIEKLVEKAESLNLKTTDSVRENDFHSLKNDVIGILEEMLEIVHAEIEDEEDSEEIS